MAKVGPTVDVDEEVDTKPEVKPDPGLLKIVGNWKNANDIAETSVRKTQGFFYAVCVYIKENKIPRAVVKATLAARGLSESSLASEVSRIMTFTKDEKEDVLEAIGRGEMTINVARAAVAKRQTNPKEPASVEERVNKILFQAARMAFGSADFPSIKDFLNSARENWNAVKEQQAERAAANGDEEEDTEEEA